MLTLNSLRTWYLNKYKNIHIKFPFEKSLQILVTVQMYFLSVITDGVLETKLSMLIQKILSIQTPRNFKYKAV